MVGGGAATVAMSRTQRMMTILALSVLSILSLVYLINDDTGGMSDSDSIYSISSSGGVYRQLLSKTSKAEREERRKRRAMKMKKIQNDGMNGKEVHCDDVTPEMVAKSRVYGNPGRWQKVLYKMMNKEKVKIAVLGGSVTAGAECLSPKHYWPNLKCAWPSRLQSLLTSYDPSWNVEIVNLAKGGTPSRAGLALVLGLVDYDAIIINWTANDDKIEAHYKKGGANEMKEVFETLVRSALALPKNPALILFEDYGRRMFNPEPIAEEVHHAIASVYDIPTISARAAFWDSIAFNEENNALVSQHMPSVFHDRFACLIFENLFKDSEPAKVEVEDQWFDPVTKPPVFGGTTLRCNEVFGASAFSETLKDSPLKADGWEYYADAPGKYGYISNITKSTLSFNVESIPHKGRKNKLIVNYLRSYSDEWGLALIQVSGAKTKEQIIDSKTLLHESQLAQVVIDLDDAAQQELVIKNLGGKVKIIEVFVMSCETTI